MNTAIQNRNESYIHLPLSKRMTETYRVIEEFGPITPQQALKFFPDNRPINTVQSRFTDLHERGYIKIVMTWNNEKTGQPNTVYEVMNLREKMDYTIVAAQTWTDRISQLENDYRLPNLSEETREIIKKEIKKFKNKLKNLITI
jgi:hypothetical protein|tara:strand:+ start:426 stop:857 length:432 start_codon:yes stop_codon:yes gene_type:complete